MCACMRACVRACVYLCMHACMCVYQNLNVDLRKEEVALKSMIFVVHQLIEKSHAY